jgi:hypothetical protein
MLPVGFEPTIPASARPQTYGLDRAATGIGSINKRTLIQLLFLAALIKDISNSANLLFTMTVQHTFNQIAVG